MASSDPLAQRILDQQGLDALLSVIRGLGFRTIGPTVRDGAIVLDEIAGVADMPRGWTDRQAPGGYRLERRGDGALFGHVVGPDSWKRWLHPPRVRLWRAEGAGEAMRVAPDAPAAEPLALIGVRACDLAAIAVQDRVFLGGAHVEPRYRARREAAFIVAADCAEPGALCFCASMGTGPGVSGGYDIALTELPGEDPPLLLATAGTEAGRAALDAAPGRPATAAEAAAARDVPARAAASMTRAMPEGAGAAIRAAPEHPRWAEVATACLACTNCTMVCPTCFCTTVEDRSDLDGGGTERWRRWDSCFTTDFSHIHGGPVRPGAAARYRQWLTHKLSTWVDQFGVSGCVGCGRCVAWCPVGIDLVAEARAIAAPARSGEDAR